MKKICALATLVMTLRPAFASIKVVYGVDNRQDVYQTSNALHIKLAKSTAGMIEKNKFVSGLVANTFDLQKITSLERGQNICASDKFSQQPIAPNCSGFLVGPDTLITAGHCYNSFDTPERVCKKFAWVFDYDLKSEKADPTKAISINNIYHCKSVVLAQRDDLYDFSIIKLDRRVVDREPLKFRSTGKIANNAALVVIGHPTGLPTKISAGGKVTYNKESTRFSTNLDTFHGNSGSAVFDATTGEVEGILIMGKNDYIPSISSNPESCLTVNTCDDKAKNCTAGDENGTLQYGELVLRIEKIAPFIIKALATK